VFLALLDKETNPIIKNTIKNVKASVMKTTVNVLPPLKYDVAMLLSYDSGVGGGACKNFPWHGTYH
jgi:hypothetical protein